MRVFSYSAGELELVGGRNFSLCSGVAAEKRGREANSREPHRDK